MDTTKCNGENDFNQLIKHLKKRFGLKESNFKFPILFDVKDKK